MTDKYTILVFTKSPDSPQAKTRLRSSLQLTSCGSDQISLQASDWVGRLHESFVYDLFDAVEATTITNRTLALAESPGKEVIIPKRWSCFLQEGESFLERLQHAWQKACTSTDSGLILVGSDCPLLSPAIFEQALGALQRGQGVIGPSPAGGYYLLGLPRSHFGIKFSDSLLSPLEAVALSHSLGNLPLHLLPYLPDVDTDEDLVSLKALLDLRESEARWNAQTYLPARTTQTMKALTVQRTSDDTRQKIPILERDEEDLC